VPSRAELLPAVDRGNVEPANVSGRA
jgi:hypothetical protein